MRTLMLVMLVVLGLIGSAIAYVHVRVSRLVALHTALDLTAGPAGGPAAGQPGVGVTPSAGSGGNEPTEAGRPNAGTPLASPPATPMAAPGLMPATGPKVTGMTAAGQTTAPSGAGGPPWRVETPAGDFLEVTRITPPPGSSLALKDQVTVEYRFGLTSIGQCLVYAKPLAKGKRVTRGGSNSGSPMMPGPTGTGSFEFRFGAPAECDALEVFMEVGDLLTMLYGYRVLGQDLHLLTLRLPCPLTWK